MFTKERQSNLLYGILALLFSVLLYFNANGSSVSNPITSPSTLEETISDVVIQPIYDTEKYFVQGYQPTATVRLSSLNRILLNGEANEETRSFRVVADLTGLTEGTHVVPLKVQNLTTGVTALIDPTSITVTIEQLVTKKFPVDVHVADENLATGYELTEISSSPMEVEVTTGDQSMEEIKKVTANLENLTDLDKRLTKEVSVNALNDKGEIINAVLSPNKVKVTLNVKMPSKEIPLYIEQTGIVPEDVQDFEYELNQLSVVLYGSSELLDHYSSLGIPLDITNIREKTQKTLSMPAISGLIIQPQQVEVTITPNIIKQEEPANSTSSSTQAPASSESTDISKDSETKKLTETEPSTSSST
ncbi:YbbR-like domain-containing protein [Enterococcus lemanii]|uniref:YbbR-like domain-containing protein n=1 Tax=Enterococcus lemanii TaxID=1159752 RepID=A0ABV9MXX0_9ENTE|nr:CdaR family protein [Enterococcus lemanii]MBM7707905.1 YbbR domain-containing protein [Enterococcus lemanii]